MAIGGCLVLFAEERAAVRRKNLVSAVEGNLFISQSSSESVANKRNLSMKIIMKPSIIAHSQLPNSVKGKINR